MESIPTLCFLGQMVGRNAGLITTQGQIAADLFRQSGYSVVCASSEMNRFRRMADIVTTIWQNRRVVDLIIVEVYSGLSFLLADVVGSMAKCLDIPSIGVLHGGDLPRYCKKYPSWTARVLRRFDCLSSPSRFLADEIDSQGRSVRVIPNIIDIELYPFRQRYQLEPRMLWMRAFHEIYQPDLAVKVFSLVKARFPGATMTMAGPDKGLAGFTKELARKLGVLDGISFPGFLGHQSKLSAFAHADIFLNTNRIDNMPVAVIEACAMGLPVVATDVGGLKYLLTDGDNGLLVPDGDECGMADAVSRLLSQPELAERLSRNGRSLAEKSSWQSVRPQWESLFAEILNGKKRRAKPSTRTTFERSAM